MLNSIVVGRRWLSLHKTPAWLNCAAVLGACVLALRLLWPLVPVQLAYALFGSALGAIGTFILAYGPAETRRIGPLSLIVPTATIGAAYLLRGGHAVDFVIAALKLRPHPLQRFAQTPPGFLLTPIGLICFCALFATAVHALIIRRSLLGATAVILL
jgi:hypothetical protein